MPGVMSPEQKTPNCDYLDLGGKTLYVNDGPLGTQQIGALRQSSPDMALHELRRRYNEDGYVFLKGLLPRDDVLKAREAYFTMLAPTGVLKPGTREVEGIYDSSKDPANFPGFGAGVSSTNSDSKIDQELSQQFNDLAMQAHYADWYKDTFCNHPTLKDFIARFTGWENDTLSLRRSLLRNNTPGNKAIGVHYDQIFLRHGEPTSVTAWIPMGDISLQGGGLIYLEHGHTLGQETESAFTEKASHLTEEQAKSAYNQNMLSSGLLAEGPREYAETFGRRWLVTAYEAGDVVLHTPFTIHASTLNHDPSGRIRLGTDLRFVDSSKQWDKRWDKYLTPNDGL